MEQNKIKIFREELGISQLELADALGMYQPYISLLEQGKHKASPSMLNLMRFFFETKGIKIK